MYDGRLGTGKTPTHVYLHKGKPYKIEYKPERVDGKDPSEKFAERVDENDSPEKFHGP